MKRLIYSFLAFVLLLSGYSCSVDESLDPLQTNSILKGKLLSLRGAQLKSIYFDGKPGAEFFPRIATSADKFVFEAEYLAQDKNSLQSVDFFVNKKVGNVITRVLLSNVPFSQFVNDGKYPNPWVTVTFTLSDILAKLGLSNTFPLNNATVNTLLTTYKFGIPIEGDLNLTDGSIAPAAKVVAAGLFQSNQFYPAQKLTYTVTDYCSYNADQWKGTWGGDEVGACCGGTDTNVFTQDATNKNKFTMDNFWGDGVDAYVIFSPSTKPDEQIVTIPTQPTSEGGIASGVGTYNSCLETFTINTTYKLGGTTYVFLYIFHR